MKNYSITRIFVLIVIFVFFTSGFSSQDFTSLPDENYPKEKMPNRVAKEKLDSSENALSGPSRSRRPFFSRMGNIYPSTGEFFIKPIEQELMSEVRPDAHGLLRGACAGARHYGH